MTSTDSASDAATGTQKPHHSGIPVVAVILRRVSAVPRGYLRRHPVATSFGAVALLAFVATATVVPTEFFGIGPQALLQSGRWWTPLTALLVPASLVQALIVVALSLTLLARTETVLGRRRTLIALFGIGVPAVVLSVLAQAALWTIASCGRSRGRRCSSSTPRSRSPGR